MIEQIGRYQIAGELGRGAMGIVYRAEDPAIGRTVAIKTIRLAELSDPREQAQLRDRLIREARSAGVLSHPGIVTIYDIAEENGLCYIFMEFVDGSTLESMIVNQKLPEPGALLGIFRQTADALDFAHKRGIVHRDVKPANIMVDENGVAKVTDFGVARFVSSEMTQSGAAMGTPSYMSPEQIQGHPVDGRADQFSLAVILYETLTGEKPFVGDSLPSLVYRIVRDEPVPAHRINPSLNGGVDGVLRKALSKDPANRFATCTDFVNALAMALATARGWRPLPPGLSSSMPTVVMPAAPARESIPRPMPPPPPPPPPPSGSVGRGAIIGGLAGILVLAFLFTLPRYIQMDRAANIQRTPRTPPAGRNPPPLPAATKPDTAVEPEVTKPSPAPEADAEATPAVTDREPEPRPEAPPPAAVVKPRPEPRPPDSQVNFRFHTIEFRTEPPGTRITVDNDSNRTCTTPCSIVLPGGRHTLRATHDGYHDALKIFQVEDDTELRFNLSQRAGQLIIRTNPNGASIYLNGKVQGKRSPAVLTVPAGHYRLTLEREGYATQEDEIEIRDGAISNYEFSWIR